MSRFCIIGARGYPNYYGGFETLIRHVAPYLVSRGHNVTVYARESRMTTRAHTVDGVEVRFTPGIDRHMTSTLTFGGTASIDALRQGFDAALFLNVANGPYLKWFRRRGIPTCINVDGVEWQRGKWGPTARWLFRYGARSAKRHGNALIFDSRAVEEIWKHEYGCFGRFIPYGAPVLHEVGTDILRQHNLPTSGYVLSVCRIVPENNLGLLLNAVELLDPEVPVVVVGSSTYRHYDSEHLAKLGRSGRVRCLGHVDDQALLEQLWANAGVYWHGHSVGGTNPSLLQAMGLGSPVLALDTPFNREVLLRDKQMVPADPQYLARRIDEVLHSEEEGADMRIFEMQTITDRYSWESVCKAYESLLLELASLKE